jgi:riboflavin synthase
VFSGLVAARGKVRSVVRRGRGARIEVACELPGEPLAQGESIAVQGACLTVDEPSPSSFAADLSPETVARTTLGSLRAGATVNLERALRLADRLGGHLVLGHVDAAVPVVSVRRSQEFSTVRISVPAALAPEVAEKGSVAVDGVSLTVSALGAGWFEVALIPLTLAGTTLEGMRAGDLVNLETDVLAKYVRRAVGGRRTGIEALLAGPNDAAD